MDNDTLSEVPSWQEELDRLFPGGLTITMDATEDRTFVLLYPERAGQPEKGLGFDTFRALFARTRDGYRCHAQCPAEAGGGYGYLFPSSAWASVRLSQVDWHWALAAPLGASREIAGPNGPKSGLLLVVDRAAYRW